MGGRTTRIWPSVRRELRWRLGMLPLFTCKVDRVWGEHVLATDSSTLGYGVCERALNTDTVSLLGQAREKWRFMMEDLCCAREALAVPAP